MDFHIILVKSLRFAKHILYRFDILNKQGLNIFSIKNNKSLKLLTSVLLALTTKIINKFIKLYNWTKVNYNHVKIGDTFK